MRVVVWGAGGHGHVVAEACSAAGYELAGWIDRDSGVGPRCVGEPGGADQLPELLERLGAGAVALGVGDNLRRGEMASICGEHLASPIVHPAATVSPSVRLGKGAVVLPRAVINAGATVGRAVIVNSAAVVEHDCQIAAGVHVSPGAILGGGVRLGEGAWVGAGAVVLPGILVGEWAVVGAGAVVTKDVPAGTTVVGVPAKAILRERGPAA